MRFSPYLPELQQLRHMPALTMPPPAVHPSPKYVCHLVKDLASEKPMHS